MKKNEKEAARQLLISFLKENPNSADAWWLLSYTVNKKEQQIDCLKRALSLNPAHGRAQTRLSSLKNKLSPKTRTPSPKKKQKISSGIIAIVAVVFCLGIVGIGYFGFSIMNATKAEPLPVAPQVLLPTNTPRPPQSLPPTWTPTPRATVVKLPTMTPYGTTDNGTEPFGFINSTATPSVSYGYIPGAPTATPLGTDITDHNYIAGEKAYAEGDYEKAVSLMSKAIKANPELAPAYKARAYANVSLNNFELGIEDYNKALSIMPDFATAFVGRGQAHYHLGNAEQAFEDVHQGLSIDPSQILGYIVLTKYYYFYIGDSENALHQLNVALSIDPNLSSLLEFRGTVLLDLERYVECISSTTEAINLNAEEWSAFETRAICHMLSGSYSEAIADYDIFFKYDSSRAGAWYNYGIAKRNKADFPGAIEAYSRALELDPAYAEAYINRGNVHRILKHYDEALSDYNAALELREIPLAYIKRGTVYVALEKNNEAIADLEKGLSLYPINANAYCQLARAYFGVERYEDSLDAAALSDELDPECGGTELLEVQARSNYALGNLDEAFSYVDKALKNYNFYKDGYYYRGIFNEELGKKEDAIDDFELFLLVTKRKRGFDDKIADVKARLARLKQ
ncbi:MAG: tetratricopeptide repeat protein [Chloroflexi bacterium]|nr:tetratricopeptide repeat protein [Chloroflexota bacterium]